MSQSHCLVYGLRLVPQNTLKSTKQGVAILKNGEEKHVTMHVLEGTKAEIRRQLTQSLDAFFDIFPGVE